MSISEKVLRGVLYGRWCTLFIGQKGITFKSNVSDKAEYPSDDEGMSSPTMLPVLNIENSKSIQLCLINDSCMAFVSLPEQVTIAPSSIPGPQLGLFSTCWIKKGRQMGPYTGRIVKPDEVNYEIDNNLMWEVLNEDGTISHFLDAKDENPRNWMGFVNCARHEQEQNLEVFQYGGKIYYRAIKDVSPDQELLVWYGGTYMQFLGVPGIPPVNDNSRRRRKGPPGELPLPIPQEPVCKFTQEKPIAVPGQLKCTLCRRGFNSRSNLRSHMRIHTLEKSFQGE